jgi:hypothetical protein
MPRISKAGATTGVGGVLSITSGIDCASSVPHLAGHIFLND